MSSMVGEVESLVAALHSSLLNTDRELQELGAEEDVLEAWLKTQQGIYIISSILNTCDQGVSVKTCLVPSFDQVRLKTTFKAWLRKLRRRRWVFLLSSPNR